jgi:hypothetical protein
MKVSFHGFYTLEEFFQALYQEHENFQKLGIKYIRRAHLYYTPVDEQGDPVVPTDPDTGRPANNWKSDGAYKSAARDYGL